MLNGETSHNQIIKDPYQNFKVEVHNVILDKIVTKIKDRFTGNEKLYSDLSFLSPNNFSDIINEVLPDTALNALSEKLIIFYKDFDVAELKN